jgi:hypothetical protein
MSIIAYLQQMGGSQCETLIDICFSITRLVVIIKLNHDAC